MARDIYIDKQPAMAKWYNHRKKVGNTITFTTVLSAIISFCSFVSATTPSENSVFFLGLGIFMAILSYRSVKTYTKEERWWIEWENEIIEKLKEEWPNKSEEEIEYLVREHMKDAVYEENPEENPEEDK